MGRDGIGMGRGGDGTGSGRDGVGWEWEELTSACLREGPQRARLGALAPPCKAVGATRGGGRARFDSSRVSYSLHPRQAAAQDGEAGARELGRGLEVDAAQSGAELVVPLQLGRQLALAPPRAHLLVRILVVAVLDPRVEQVGQRVEEGGALGLERLDARVGIVGELRRDRNLILQRLRLRRLARLEQSADLRRERLPLGSRLVARLDEGGALLRELADAVDRRDRLITGAPHAEAPLDQVRVLSNQALVQRRRGRGRSGSHRRDTAPRGHRRRGEAWSCGPQRHCRSAQQQRGAHDARAKHPRAPPAPLPQAHETSTSKARIWCENFPAIPSRSVSKVTRAEAVAIGVRD